MEVAYLKYIVLLPLAGFILNGLLGPRFGKRFVSLVGPGTVLAAFVIALYGVLNLPHGGALHEGVFDWVVTGAFSCRFAFQLDGLSGVMALIVSGVGGLIHVYSVGYMGHDKSFARYFAYLNLFTFAMLTLVLADNLLLLFVGWEGVGLCSYLLIGFWYEDINNAVAGKKAFIVNRIGDFGFLLGIFLLLYGLGQLSGAGLSLDFAYLQQHAPALGQLSFLGVSLVGATCLLLFIGASGKSAQIPLYVWLPDAMAGPTPVSALIHAATMVTAGIYMMARLHFFYSLAPTVMAIVAAVAALTALFAATIAMQQNDIKKVLAYSTISQLGYMFAGVASFSYAAGIFHLATHAFFKALLFLGAGSVIHALSNLQDMRQMGGLRKKLPITFWTFLIATLAIAGIPPTSGFFSKDAVIWSSLLNASHSGGWLRPMVSGVLILTAWITTFYMVRLLALTFFGPNKTPEEVKSHIHESPKTMTLPLIILAILSLIGGMKFFGLHHRLMEFFHSGHLPHHIGHLSEAMLGGLISLVSALVFIVTLYLYSKKQDLMGRIKDKLALPALVLERKYWVDEFYQATVVRGTLLLARLADLFDRYVIDALVNLCGWLTRALGRLVASLQSGLVQAYAFSMALGALLIMGYIIWKL